MPRKPPEPAASPQTIAGWHARRGTLLAKLHADPDGPWAWLWQVHVDIVDYLLHRYAGELGGADDVGASEEPAQVNDVPDSTASDEGASASPIDVASEPELPGLHGSARVARAASLEGPEAERVRSTLRDRLSSLHDTNTARRATQPRVKPAPSYRPLFGTLFLPTPRAHFDIRQVRRTTFPEDGWQPLDDDAGVEPFDETSLALFRQAIAYDQDWDLEIAEALTEDDVMRLLLGDNGDTEAGDVGTA